MLIHPIDTSITYREWCELMGQYRWYRQDGSARAILPLDYNWKSIYDVVTADADRRFRDYVIEEPETFTEMYLSEIPTAWLKFKTILEMFLGTLDGFSIDPKMFEAGYTRTTNSNTDINGNTSDRNVASRDVDVSQTETAESSATTDYGKQGNQSSATTDYGKQSNQSDGKSRSLNYLQGAQGLDDINNGNIGELGNRYASSIQDGISKTSQSIDPHKDSTESKQNIDAHTDGTETNSSGTNTGEQHEGSSSTDTGVYDDHTKFWEEVKETRINYYDNLAFLRDRLDRIKELQPFYSFLEHLFINVTGMVITWW